MVEYFIAFWSEDTYFLSMLILIGTWDVFAIIHIAVTKDLFHQYIFNPQRLAKGKESLWPLPLACGFFKNLCFRQKEKLCGFWFIFRVNFFYFFVFSL